MAGEVRILTVVQLINIVCLNRLGHVIRQNITPQNIVSNRKQIAQIKLFFSRCFAEKPDGQIENKRIKIEH